VRLPWFRVPALRSVQRGDVIVFEFPGQREELQSPEFMFYLKRCVALGGDTIQVINRILYVNGKPALMPRNMKFNNLNPRPQGYADPKIFPRDAPFNEDFWGPVVVPKQGDVLDVNSSTYARWSTFIAREGHRVRLDERSRVTVDGAPVTKYVVRRNYLFGMGDNRDNSLDSRFWGFIPEENIVGTPMIVYWSWDPERPLTGIVDKIESIRLGRIGTLIR